MKVPFNYNDQVVSQIEKKLKDDKMYYGKYGKQWLSNSDLYALLNDPTTFRKEKETTKAMIEGSYLHTAMLEPHKLKDYEIVDVSSRNTKAYKTAISESTQSILLLQSEAFHIERCVQAMKSNMDFCDEIYEKSNEFEVPQVGIINGMDFKGKADIVCSDKLIDIKTTSDIKNFKRSAYKYNYDSQAYIYQALFNKPLEFYVVDKSNYQLGIFKPSQQFLDYGEQKVIKALEVYDTFFSENATLNINQYIINEIL